MTRGALLEAALWMTLGLGVVALSRVTFGPVVRAVPAAAFSETRDARNGTTEAADSGVRLVIAADPFRLDRRPAASPYDPVRIEQQNAGYVPPRPALVLRGIVRGDSARAVVEGLPGADGGRMVAAGDVVGGFRVVSIGVRTVRIAGPDTTWTLSLQRAMP